MPSKPGEVLMPRRSAGNEQSHSHNGGAGDRSSLFGAEPPLERPKDPYLDICSRIKGSCGQFAIGSGF